MRDSGWIIDLPFILQTCYPVKKISTPVLYLIKIIFPNPWSFFLCDQKHMASLTLLIILRLIHISTGVFWAGSTMYLSWFITPAVQAAGPGGGKFMQQLARTNRLPAVMTISSFLNVISGIWLLWILSEGFQLSWLSTTHGLILLTGSLLGIFAFLEGLFVTRPTAMKMNELSRLLGSGAPPSAEQLQQLEALRNKIVGATKLAAYLLAMAVVAMSLVRYL